MVKGPQRTAKQQEYRDDFAHELKKLRKYGNTGKDLAKTLLEKEKKTETYKDSDTKYLRNQEIIREEWNNSVIEYIDTEDYDTVYQCIESSSNYTLDVDVAKKLIEKGWLNIIFGLFKTDKFKPSDEMIELFLSLDDRDHMGRRDFQWLVNYLFHIGKKPKLYGCLTKKSLEKLINSSVLSRAYIANLCIFRGLDKEALFKIIDSGIRIEEFETLLYGLGNFNGLDKESFNAIVSYRSMKTLKDEGREILYKQIDNFEGLGEEEAKLLVEKGYGRYVAQHPEKFGLKKEK